MPSQLLTDRPIRRRRPAVIASVIATALLCLGSVAPAQAASAPTDTTGPLVYGYTGDEVLVPVPAGVQMVYFQMTGGSGGDASIGADGGPGATIDGAFYVSPGQSLTLGVGQAGMTGAPGWGPGLVGGGAPGASGWSDKSGVVDAGGGGGASTIGVGYGPIAVAGGGGGAGGSGNIDTAGPSHPAGGDGGAGGAAAGTGQAGTSPAGDNQGDRAGGAGGAGGGAPTQTGAAGAAAASYQGQTWGQGGGGGGGSTTGGAGGGTASTTQAYASGGGGGGAGASTITDTVFDSTISAAATSGDGSIEIYWISGTTLTASIPTQTPTASDTPVPLSVTAVDASNDPLPNPGAFVSWSSSEPTDIITDGTIIMTTAGSRTITASWIGDPTTTATITPNVLAGSLVGFEFVQTPTTVTAGTQVTLEVEGIDAWGNLRGDATTNVSYSSSIASDVFSTTSPNLLTMTEPGQHIISATYPPYTPGLITITVVTADESEQPPPSTAPQPAAPGASHPDSHDPAGPSASHLAATGNGSAPELAWAAIITALLGAALMTFRHLASSRQHSTTRKAYRS